MTTLTPTVLLPAYNAQGTITEAIRSVLAQTHRDFVLLILDDGSTDATPELARVFTKLDSRVSYVRNERNLGVIETMNKGLGLAETEWVARMDADDLCDPNRLKVQEAHLQKHPELTALSAQGTLFGDANGPIRFPTGAANVTARMFFDMPVLNAASWMNKNWLQEKGIRYDPTAPYAEDYDLFAAIQENGGIIDNLPDVLYHYRIHATSTTQSKRSAQEKTATEIRNRLLAAEGIVLTAEELEYTTQRQFFPRLTLNEFDLYMLRSIDLKVRTLRHLGATRSVFSLYERGRFLVSMLPRPKSLKEKLVLAKSLTQVNPKLAAVFLPLYLKGRA
jgi:glycosyltransferase involved in cell wall biosynthesis